MGEDSINRGGEDLPGVGGSNVPQEGFKGVALGGDQVPVLEEDLLHSLADLVLVVFPSRGRRGLGGGGRRGEGVVR